MNPAIKPMEMENEADIAIREARRFMRQYKGKLWDDSHFDQYFKDPRDSINVKTSYEDTILLIILFPGLSSKDVDVLINILKAQKLTAEGIREGSSIHGDFGSIMAKEFMPGFKKLSKKLTPFQKMVFDRLCP